jgi:hypothetical protein
MVSKFIIMGVDYNIYIYYMSRTIKTKFKIENKDNADNVMTFTISIDTNHTCSDIDKVIESMSKAPLLSLSNYKEFTAKSKKKFANINNSV